MTITLDRLVWSDFCPACGGSGLVPTGGCTCDGKAHTCTPAICDVCDGAGLMKT